MNNCFGCLNHTPILLCIISDLYLQYFFVAIFYCLSYLSFKWLGAASERKPLQYTYTILIGTALVLGSLSWIENTRLQQIVYSINLWLMGIAESPLPFLLLWASRNLNPVPKSSVKNP